jgi:hypothetical protein
MAFVPAANTMRVVLEYTLEGELVVNVYYVNKSTPIVSIDLTQIAEIFADWWDTDLGDIISTSMSLDRIVVTDLTSATGLQTIYTTGLPLAGNLAESPQPNNIAVVCSRTTGYAGRSTRGRSYIAGVGDSQVVANEINGTLQAALLASQLNLSGLIAAGGYNWVVASFVHNGAPRTTAQLLGISAFAVDSRVDTQRKRLPDV